MNLIKLSRKAILSVVLVTATALAQTPYDDGQKALRAQQWMEAARQFAEAARAPGAEGERVAAALYWRAHALYRADHRGDAARQISELERRFPDSRWISEARALQVEYGGSIVDAEAEDELRVFALSRLIERDLERALPLLLDILRETTSRKARNDALFVLGMSDSPRAQQAIAEAARNPDDPELQTMAIQLLGVASTDASMAALDGLYASARDKDVKMAVINAHIASDRASPLLEILASESDPELQRAVIYALGAMGSASALRDLYPTLTDTHTRRAAIEGFAIANDDDMLRHVLETESNPELRRSAIEGIAISGSESAPDLLKSLYMSTAVFDEKLAILEALVILDDGLEIAQHVIQNEQDPELVQSAIHILGVMGETGELAGMYRRFDDVATRRTVLEAMAIADDGAGLRVVLQAESSPGLRAEAVRSIAVLGDKGAGAFLAGLYPASESEQEKLAIIDSMMVLEDATALIAIMESEQDPGLRRRMLEVLTMMDTDEANEYLFGLLEPQG